MIINQFQYAKSGGGIMYFTAWQKIFNTDPEPVTDKFLITTSFEKKMARKKLI
jgi:hypothetical protein